MSKSRFSCSQILAILKQAEGCLPVNDLFCEHGTNNASFHYWRSKSDGMDASMTNRLKELEVENTLNMIGLQ